MTPSRFARLRAALDRRQPDLTVLLDNVHKPHNFSAILRSCDAAGVLAAHAVWPDPRLRPNRYAASGAGRWVRVVTHPDVATAAAALRADGFRIVAAHPGEEDRAGADPRTALAPRAAAHFRAADYTVPTAFLLGAELEGVSAAGLRAADLRVAIPMHGLGHSLNVSVAAALLLFEAERQREAAGLYAGPRLEPGLYRATLFEWAQPAIARYCRRHRRPYPPLDERGEVVGDDWRRD